MTTASGLVFSGGAADRMFRALDASTGQLSWQAPTSSGVMGQPSTFMVNGKPGAGVRITGDRPLSRLLFWSIPNALCPEAYVTMSIPPGGEYSWTIRYDFNTLSARH